MGAACSSGTVNAPPVTLEPLPFQLRRDAADLIPHGEVCEFEVSWHIFTMGTIVFEAQRRPGHPHGDLHLRSTTTPTRLAAALSKFGGVADSYLHSESFSPQSYEWLSPTVKNRKRRLNWFDNDRVRSLEMSAMSWEGETFPDRWAHDPLSVLYLLRVAELSLNQEIRVIVVEGTKRRLATIRRGAEEILRRGRREPPINVIRYGLRMDKIVDSNAVDIEAEVDQNVLISADSTRSIVRAEGLIRGQPIVINLKKRWIADQAP